MKRFAAGMVLGFLASCAIAFASSDTDHNGMFWNKLSRGAKDGYIDGYADATGVTVSKLETLTTAGDLFHWKGSRKVIREVQAQLSRSELAPEDAVSRLDSLYKNSKYGELDLGTALQLLALHPEAISSRASSSTPRDGQ
jgi:hypothetical protein